MSIKIPRNVIRLQEDTFFGCYALEMVYIPETVTEIEGDVFFVCNNQLIIYTEKDFSSI